MRIPCPYCGTRSNDEFTVMGDADAYLARPAASTLAAFHDYAYLRDNKAGAHRELWHHTAGCKQWLVVTRHTLTHAVLDVAVARDATRRGGVA